MHALQQFSIKEQTFWLSSDRSIFWEREKALIVSDLHFGKTGHFRKSGIAVPQSVFREDIQRLVAQVQYFKPDRLIVVGDMFHSTANKELDLFSRWRNDFPSLPVQLVRGNHDILHKNWYYETGIEVWEKTLTISGFCFQHDPGDCGEDNDHYVFSGHIHPGITIHGLGKQSLRFPCFYFTERYCILPAFSKFTGTVSVRPKEKETAFAIVENSLVRIN
ncbi:MAG: ligase-associated DNA damage response endonuclease PdeM [Flavitalea sp.]